MLKTWVAGAALATMVAATVAAQAQQNDGDPVKARQRISMMEAVLERAVANGADNVLRQIRNVMPDQPMLSGAPQVRGFRLEGYGVFFDVGLPPLALPIMWSMRSVIDDNRAANAAIVAQLRAVVRSGQLSPRERERVEQLLSELEAQAGPAALRSRTGAPRMNAASTGAPVPPSAVVPPPAAPVDPGIVDNPNDAYTREVKAALVDAMLENSGPMALGADEWLTVAARDNAPRDALIPGDTLDFSTIIFRVKGSDLAAFRAGRLTLEEARMRIDVREY
jgi:hypothetical protein